MRNMGERSGRFFDHFVDRTHDSHHFRSLRAQYGHAFQVPRQANQRPLMASVGKPAQHELAESHHRLDDPEHRFDRLLAQRVGSTTVACAQPVLHHFQLVVAILKDESELLRERLE